MNQQTATAITAFSAVQASGTDWRGKCPVCNHNSLLLSEGRKQPVTAWCSRGCDKKAVNAAVYKAVGSTMPAPEPFTVAQFCKMKKLPEHWVSSLFLVHDSHFWSSKKRKFSTTPPRCAFHTWVRQMLSTQLTAKCWSAGVVA